MRKRGLVKTVMFTLTCLALAAFSMWNARSPSLAEIKASDIYVIDGDTIDLKGERIRLTGYDTPETKYADCSVEKALGDKATARLRALISGAARIELAKAEHLDKYGRGLGQLYLDGEDAGEILIREDLARSYHRGARLPWC
jgi:endonuclease YncB( thermonuclease family)